LGVSHPGCLGSKADGGSVGALSAAVPVYQSETAPKEIRGSLVSTYQLLITAGIFVAYAICVGTRNITKNGGSWRTPIAIGWIWAVVLGVGILYMPESPRWLVQQGKYDAARLSLARVRGVAVDTDHVEYAFAEIAEDVKKEEAGGKGSWLECFVGTKGTPKVAYRTYLVMALQMFQQLTGGQSTPANRLWSDRWYQPTTSSTMAPPCSLTSVLPTRLRRN